MKRSWRNLAIMAFLMCLPGFAFAQAKVGTSTFEFLKIGPSARAVAMGEAFIAVANDASATYYNPGAMITIKKPNFLLSHVSYPAGVSYDYISGVYPVPQLDGVLGGFVSGLTTDNINETTPEMPYGTGRTFTVSEFTGGISACRKLTNKFSVGLNARYIRSNLADVSATGWSADVGTYYETGWKRIRIAMVIQNFGPDVKYLQEEQTLPMNFKFGGSAEVYSDTIRGHSVTVAFEGWHPNDNVEMYTIGAEYSYRDFIMFRLGKKMNGFHRNTWSDYVASPTTNDPFIEYPIINEKGGLSTDGASVGFGIKLPMGLSVDYALANIGFFGELHRFTLSYAMK